MSNRLRFPLVAQDNRPIYDALGNLVSVPEHAQFFTSCANLVHAIANAERGLSDETRSEEFSEFRRQARKVMEANR